MRGLWFGRARGCSRQSGADLRDGERARNVMEEMFSSMGIMGAITVAILAAAGIKLWQQSREEQSKKSK